MVKKFSVGISDELAARLEPFKGRYSPTAVFQKAMEDQAEKLEALQKARKAIEEGMPEGDDMDAIIKRLEQERTESEDRSFNSGEKEGLAFAKIANYETLKYAATVLAETCDLAERDLTRDSMLGDYFQNLIDDDDNLAGELSEKWLQGWAWSLRTFWDKLPSNLRQ